MSKEKADGEGGFPWENLDFDVLASQFKRATMEGANTAGVDDKNQSPTRRSSSLKGGMGRGGVSSFENTNRLERRDVDVLSPRNLQSRLPDELPGKPKKHPSEEANYNGMNFHCGGQKDLKQYTACVGKVDNSSLKAVESKKVKETPKDQLEYDFDSCSSLSRDAGAESTSKRPKESNEEERQNLEGHYMYVAYSRFGEKAQDVIQLCEHASIPSSNHRAGEVLVQVLASNVSRTDCEIRRGEWSKMKLDPYIIPGVGFVGRVDESERKAAFQNFKPGDLVMSLVPSGANARYLCARRDNLVKLPSDIDPMTAVCLVETYLAAFQALHFGQKSSIRYRETSMRGKAVLILGAGSPNVCQAFVEVCQAANASFVYVTGKEKSFSKISELGAVPLTRDPLDWLTLIGRQIGLIICLRGNGEEVTKDHLKALDKEGRVVLVGEPGARLPVEVTSPSPSKLVCRSSKRKLSDRAECYNVFDNWDADIKQGKKDLAYLLKLLQEGKLSPKVLERIPLSKVAKAQSIIESKKVSGFIVCEPWIQEKF